MKRIKIQNDVASSRQFKKYFCKYAQKRGYETPIESLPFDIVSDLASTAVMAYSAIDLSIGEEFELEITDSIVFKCTKVGKYEINFDKETFLKVLNVSSDDPMLEVLANPLNSKRLSKSESFTHPLAEVTKGELNGEIQDLLNGYAVACCLINVIRNPEDSMDNGQQATESMARMILESDSSVNVQVLIEKIKAGELSAMMKASTLINDGFNKLAQNQLNR